jgi:cysteine desulfurase/selenocysteine lyase
VTDFDVQRARRDTPGCDRRIHLNNAGAALMPTPVLDACRDYLELESLQGGYEAAALRLPALEQIYDLAAGLVGADRDEIALVDSGTRAWHSAVYGIPLRPGDRILTCNAEYASNYIALLHMAKRTGATIEVIPDDDAGQVSVEALRDMVDERVRLISVVHVPTNGGLVNPAAAVGEVAREIGAIYVLDAVQSVGQFPVDVRAIGCDILAATGRKYLRGPRGTGFLYVRRGLIAEIDPPILDLHSGVWIDPSSYGIRSDARRFELWEKSYVSLSGLGAAITYAQCWGMARIGARVAWLGETMRAELDGMPGIHVQDLGREKCGIVTFTVDGATGFEVRDGLAARGINVSVSRARSTKLDMDRRGLESVIRASVHYYNSEAEIERFLHSVGTLTGS